MATSKGNTILLGERRKFMLRLWLDGHQSFLPTNPTYTLKKAFNDLVVDDGFCDVEPSGTPNIDYTVILSTYVEPADSGDYILEFSFGFLDEIIKKIGYITVLTDQSQAYRMSSDIIVG